MIELVPAHRLGPRNTLPSPTSPRSTRSFDVHRAPYSRPTGETVAHSFGSPRRFLGPSVFVISSPTTLPPSLDRPRFRHAQTRGSRRYKGRVALGLTMQGEYLPLDPVAERHLLGSLLSTLPPLTLSNSSPYPFTVQLEHPSHGSSCPTSPFSNPDRTIDHYGREVGRRNSSS